MSNIPVRNTKKHIAEEVIQNPGSSDAEQRLLTFVEEQVEKMRGYAKFNAANGQPGFFELNRALSEHQIVWLGLVTLNAMAKIELSRAKEAYDDWFSEKYIDKRNELNPRSMAATKWYSTKEIEMYVRVENKEDFHKYDRALTMAEHKVAHIRRLLEGWSSQQFALARLSKNVEAEFGSGQLEDISF